MKVRKPRGTYEVQWVSAFDGAGEPGGVEVLQAVELLTSQPHRTDRHVIGCQSACTPEGISSPKGTGFSTLC